MDQILTTVQLSLQNVVEGVTARKVESCDDGSLHILVTLQSVDDATVNESVGGVAGVYLGSIQQDPTAFDRGILDFITEDGPDFKHRFVLPTKSVQACLSGSLSRDQLVSRLFDTYQLIGPNGDPHDPEEVLDEADQL